MSTPRKIKRPVVAGIDLNRANSANSHITERQNSFNLGSEIRYVDSDGETVITFDKLVKKDYLGHGNFGYVCRYYFQEKNMYFAMKQVLNRKSDSEIRGQSETFRDLEVQMKAGDSPFTVKFYGAFYKDSEYWILTECMDASLEHFYKQAHKMSDRIPELFMSKVTYSILNGIKYLSTRKIIHRDIKPSNMLINFNGDIKLCDFGISGFLQNSRAKTHVGCQIYMSPEKIKPSDEGYAIESELWALGISIVEIAEGKHPMSGLELFAQIDAILSKDSPKLSTDKYSPEFCLLVDIFLKKEPNERGTIESALHSEFVTKYENDKIDVEYIKPIIEKQQTELKQMESSTKS